MPVTLVPKTPRSSLTSEGIEEGSPLRHREQTTRATKEAGHEESTVLYRHRFAQDGDPRDLAGTPLAKTRKSAFVRLMEQPLVA